MSEPDINSAEELLRECGTFAERMMERYGAIGVIVDVRTPESVCDSGARVWRGDSFTVYAMARRLVIEQETYWRTADKQRLMESIEDEDDG